MASVLPSYDSEIFATILVNDPEVNRFHDMLLASNMLQFNHRKFNSGVITDWDKRRAQLLDRYQQAALNDFVRKRIEKLKESSELEKIKREKPELEKIKREKKLLKKIKREKKELKKKKRAETTLLDGDEAPLKKLKLVEVEDNHADEETMTLEAVTSEDVDLQRQGVPHFAPVGNLIAEGLKACTSQAEKKNENVDQSKDM